MQPLVTYLRAWELESWVPVCEAEELDCDAWALMVSELVSRWVSASQ